MPLTSPRVITAAQTSKIRNLVCQWRLNCFDIYISSSRWVKRCRVLSLVWCCTFFISFAFFFVFGCSSGCSLDRWGPAPTATVLERSSGRSASYWGTHCAPPAWARYAFLIFYFCRRMDSTSQKYHLTGHGLQSEKTALFLPFGRMQAQAWPWSYFTTLLLLRDLLVVVGTCPERSDYRLHVQLRGEAGWRWAFSFVLPPRGTAARTLLLCTPWHEPHLVATNDSFKF